MSGEETLEQMKALRPNIPILLSSGFNEAQAVARFQGKGLAGFLQKPYRAASLVEKVRSAVTHLPHNDVPGDAGYARCGAVAWQSRIPLNFSAGLHSIHRGLGPSDSSIL